jgi:uncharacterized membrane protein
MSEPNDDTQVGFSPPDETPARAADADATPGVILPPPGPAPAGGIPAPAPAPLGSVPAAPAEADPAPTTVSPTDPAAPAGSAPPGTVPPGTVPPATVPPGGAPPLRADPNRPAASAWREPPWFPPRPKSRGPSVATIVVGLVIVAIGLYYLLDVTFGLDLPRITWGALWPLILIIVGGLILLRAISRR